MDEERFIDWYAVVDAVANGRLSGHACPLCGHHPLETSADGVQVRVRCPACGEGFEGALGQGRDDALYAEADALVRRQDAARAARGVTVLPGPPPAGGAPWGGALVAGEPGSGAPAPAGATPPTPVAPAQRPTPDPARTRPEPWAWSLPESGGDDLDALSAWMDVLTAVHNGRRSGLRCPFCSEPLTDIVVRDPHVRLRCTVCGETFEGQVR